MGSTSFLSFPFKIQSLQIGEKIEVKSGKNIWTKLPPPLLTFLAFFFSSSSFVFSSLWKGGLFVFLLFFSSFLGFVRTWWVILIFLSFFFKF